MYVYVLTFLSIPQWAITLGEVFLIVSRMLFDAYLYHIPIYSFLIDLFIQVEQSFLCACNIVHLYHLPTYRKKIKWM